MTDKDWIKLHEISLAIHHVADERALASLVVEVLPRLIGCDYACWNEHHS